jgi:shikimate dehydrogenase
MKSSSQWRYVVIGYPVSHSRSPKMQNAAFEFYNLGSPYGIMEVAPQELAQFVNWAKENLDGVNLTIPHKTEVIPLIDEIDQSALIAQSVNTLVIKDKKVKGYSTDGYGLEFALKEEFQLDIKDKRFCFAGCGGVVNATAFYLAQKGAKEIRILNRTIQKASSLLDRLATAFPSVKVECSTFEDQSKIKNYLENTDVLIQATSLGLKDNDPAPFDLTILENLNLAVYDTIYKETKLIQAAKKLGLKCANGKEMLIGQGAKSFELWTNKKAPVEEMRKGFEQY